MIKENTAASAAKKMLKKYYKLMLGYLLVVLGIIGLFTPFLQGILFLALGSVILSTHSKTFRKLKDRIKVKYPRAYAFVTSRIHKKHAA